MSAQVYPSDLTDSEWAILKEELPKQSKIGRPRTWSYRQLLDGMLYVLKTGCAWRFLPETFPPWGTVFSQFRRWRINGTWERIHTHLREMVRVRLGRNAQPSAGIIDSQSAKTTEAGGPRGFDGGKKVNGRKRHILVDTLGLILRVAVHPADIQDRDGGKLVLQDLREDYPNLDHVWADRGYTGGLIRWAKEHAKVHVEVVYPWWRQAERYAPEALEGVKRDKTFNVLPRRWVVERTFAWLGKCRRLSKDYEALPETTEVLVYLAMIRLMVKRLTRAPPVIT